MSYRNDKSICTFYEKIGACRHGEKCSRKHVKPVSSLTILLPNLYQNPKMNKNDGSDYNNKQLQEIFDQFYKDVFVKFASFGEIKDIVVCENDNDHLNGNVYVRFSSIELAISSVLDLNTRWYNMKPVHCELSPVISFSDANCRAYDNNACTRGEKCNFMHMRKPTTSLKYDLNQSQSKSALFNRLVLLNKLVQENQEKLKDESNVEELPTSTTSMVEELFS